MIKPSNNHLSQNHVISVIIPTVGRDSISATIEALNNQDRRPDEILIIEDKERNGAGWARNQGFLQAHGDLVAFTDDDCSPPPDWLQTLVQTLDEFNADGVGGTLEETDSLLRDKRLRRKFPPVALIDDYGWVGDTGNVIYKREWLENLQKRDNYVFNEKMVNAQDAECAWRLRRYGAKLVYVPKNVIHLRKLSTWGYFRHQFTRGTGIAQLYLAYRREGTTITHQKSLVWGQTGTGTGPRWVKAFFRNILGPFDRNNFSSTRNFIIFWAGEKFQALGFVYYLALKR